MVSFQLHLVITPLALSNEVERSCASEVIWPTSDGGFDKTSDSEVFGLDSDGKNEEYIEKCVPFMIAVESSCIAFSSTDVQILPFTEVDNGTKPRR